MKKRKSFFTGILLISLAVGIKYIDIPSSIDINENSTVGIILRDERALNASVVDDSVVSPDSKASSSNEIKTVNKKIKKDSKKEKNTQKKTSSVEVKDVNSKKTKIIVEDKVLVETKNSETNNLSKKIDNSNQFIDASNWSPKDETDKNAGAIIPDTVKTEWERKQEAEIPDTVKTEWERKHSND